MNAALSQMDLLLILFCIVTEAGRELCFKYGADGLELKEALRSKCVWAGMFLWGVELIAWVRVLEHVSLTIAFPIMALMYVVTFSGGVWLLREPFFNRHLLGALLVTLGVALIGSSGV